MNIRYSGENLTKVVGYKSTEVPIYRVRYNIPYYIPCLDLIYHVRFRPHKFGFLLEIEDQSDEIWWIASQLQACNVLTIFRLIQYGHMVGKIFRQLILHRIYTSSLLCTNMQSKLI